jgi:hypothetical protein
LKSSALAELWHGMFTTPIFEPKITANPMAWASCVDNFSIGGPSELTILAYALLSKTCTLLGRLAVLHAGHQIITVRNFMLTWLNPKS